MNKVKVVVLVVSIIVSAGIFSANSVFAKNKRCDIVVPKHYSTIQSAVDSAQSGDTVCIKKGIYTESTIDIIDKDVSLIGAGKGKTVIEFVSDGTEPDIWHPENHSIISMENVSSATRIEGLTLKNAYYYGIHLIDSSPSITNNEMVNGRLGIKIVRNSKPEVSYNTIYDNGDYGIVNASSVGGYEISHNTLVNNANQSGWGTAAIIFNQIFCGTYFYPVNPIIIKDNIIMNSQQGVWEARAPSNFKLVNNLFYGNSQNLQTLIAVYNTEEEINSLDGNDANIVADPLFRNTKNFKIKRESPAFKSASDGRNIGAW